MVPQDEHHAPAIHSLLPVAEPTWFFSLFAYLSSLSSYSFLLHQHTFFLCFLSSSEDIFLLLFRERGKDREREREKHRYEREALVNYLPYVTWVEIVCIRTSNWIHNLGTCPDGELNPKSFSYRMTLQPTKPHLLGQYIFFEPLLDVSTAFYIYFELYVFSFSVSLNRQISEIRVWLFMTVPVPRTGFGTFHILKNKQKTC